MVRAMSYMSLVISFKCLTEFCTYKDPAIILASYAFLTSLEFYDIHNHSHTF